MKRVLTCTGEYAKAPYYFDKVYVNLYSIEELCYVMVENAFLLEKDIMNNDLVIWIENQCKLPELARELYRMITHSVDISTFVGTILDYVGYYSKPEIDKVESILRMNVSMNVFEKWKAKADFLVENRHFNLAITEYEKLLKNIPENETTLISSVYNNIGVAYMNLYIYDSARENFLKAYNIDGNSQALKHFLILLRMSLTDDEYVRLASESEERYKMSMVVEQELEQAKHLYQDSEVESNLSEIFALKNEGNVAEYYEKIGKIADKLKEDYRDIILDSEKADVNFETTI